MIQLERFVFNPFQENTYLLSDSTRKCIIIDPGMNNSREQLEIIDYITKNKLYPEAMVNTHCHVDHILGCRFLADQYKIPFFFHSEEQGLIDGAIEYGTFFGLDVSPPPVPERYLDDDISFRFGSSEIRLIHVPGHSRGSLSLYSEDGKFILTGDVLFRSGIGRTDLPGGDYETILNSIRNKLLVLPRDTTVYPGHGPETTIGEEHDTNPFLN